MEAFSAETTNVKKDDLVAHLVQRSMETAKSKEADLAAKWQAATNNLVSEVETLCGSAVTTAIDNALGNIGAKNMVKYGNDTYWPLEPPNKLRRVSFVSSAEIKAEIVAAYATAEVLKMQRDVNAESLLMKAPKDPKLSDKPAPRVYLPIEQAKDARDAEFIKLMLGGKVSANSSGVPASKSVYCAGEVNIQDDCNQDTRTFYLHISPYPAMLTPSSDAFAPGWSVRVLKPKETKDGVDAPSLPEATMEAVDVPLEPLVFVLCLVHLCLRSAE